MTHENAGAGFRKGSDLEVGTELTISVHFAVTAREIENGMCGASQNVIDK